MKRNFYAVLLLVMIVLVVSATGRYVAESTARTQDQVRLAFQSARAGEFDQARMQYAKAADLCRQDSRILYLLVRRSLLDEIQESLALLGNYAQADNLADLSVETARVTEQLDQLRQSFLAGF